MSKLRRDLINHYAREMPDALLDVLEMRGLIPQLVERYNTRERCIRPQGGGWPWRARDLETDATGEMTARRLKAAHGLFSPAQMFQPRA